MFARYSLAVALVLPLSGVAPGQTPGGKAQWKSPATSAALESHRVRVAHRPVTEGIDTLPRDHGQTWKTYDISGYTARVSHHDRPEQAIIDWVLRETGTEVWFSEPLGLLNASRTTLSVYHTPEMQQIVADVVDRFVSSNEEPHVFSLRLVTVDSPNWRARAMALMRPVPVQSPGIHAWLLSKENAAVLYSELSKRTDFREHNSPNVLIQNGQSQRVSRTRPQNYVGGVNILQTGHELEMKQLEEGYSLEFSPLMSVDERTIDAVIKCHIDQVEKFVPISIDIPTASGSFSRAQIQVPQLASWRLLERFRWPSDQVLLLSCGVIATPGPDRPTAFGIPTPFSFGPARADAMLFIDSKGRESQALVNTARGGPAGASKRY